MLDDTYTIENLVLDRPLIVFDIEATGINRRIDRLIDLGMVKLNPDGSSETHVFRVHPERPIPPETTAIHGITDEDVKDCPPFRDIAEYVAELMAGCDLAGYNCHYFDIPMMEAEFARAKVPWRVDDCRVIDAQRIFHKREPRDLTAALKYYCGLTHEAAHGALPDVVATIRVIEGQLKMYEDLPHDVEALDLVCDPKDPSWVDRLGRLRWADGEAVINFGKNSGKSLRELALGEPGFLKWILSSDFPEDTRRIVQAALEGNFPQTPEPPGQ